MLPELDDEHIVAICQQLSHHSVQFVVIGGAAARLHGTGHSTVDIDICPSRSEENLTRLTQALTALGARLRVADDPEGIPFALHPDTFRQVFTMTLVTRWGPLDLCFAPAGFDRGYEMIHRNATIVELGDVEIPVAALEDVVASKRAAGRPKDIVALPALEAHLDP